jgi:hypothetical protein
MNKCKDYDIGLLTNDEMGIDFQSSGNCSNDPGRINSFLNIRGYPYILNDYLENTTFKQIDTSLISSGISISNTEAGRSIVNISIDDTRPITGNRMKYANLIEAVFKNVRRDIQNILPVFQKVLVVQINYRLENQRTGKVLKETSEKLAIDERDYFLNANVQSVSDNAMDSCIITNFADSISTTVTEFLHGSETMICRITGVELFYPAVIYSHHKHSPGGPSTTIPSGTTYNPVCQSYQYNDLYHFDNNGQDIHLHQTEIEDKPDKDLTLIPVGSMTLDKVFNVNTGHKITFKYSIWKADVIMVKNTKRIEEILGGAPYRQVNKTIEAILDRLDDIKAANTNQDIKLDEIVKRLDNVMSDDQADTITDDIIKSYGSQ